MEWTNSQRGRYRPLALFLLACLGTGAVSSQFTTAALPVWYAGLVHPAIAPPNWVFAPVWTALYVTMAVAAWRVWIKAGLKSAALYAFWLQLFLNFCWSGIFFGLHRIDLALAEILLLDAAILASLVLFWSWDRIAGLLMVPYLAWSGFATLLTYEFWRLNP
jgi:tryptophan-rich sensory protein